LVNADLGHSAGDYDTIYIQRAQPVRQIGIEEGVVRVLLDDRLVSERVQLPNDVGAFELRLHVSIEPTDARPATAGWRSKHRRPFPHQSWPRSGDEFGEHHRQGV